MSVGSLELRPRPMFRNCVLFVSVEAWCNLCHCGRWYDCSCAHEPMRRGVSAKAHSKQPHGTARINEKGDPYIRAQNGALRATDAYHTYTRTAWSEWVKYHVLVSSFGCESIRYETITTVCVATKCMPRCRDCHTPGPLLVGCPPPKRWPSACRGVPQRAWTDPRSGTQRRGCRTLGPLCDIASIVFPCT